jgi:5-formyltetrahydrofolate cyclo-ligase
MSASPTDLTPTKLALRRTVKAQRRARTQPERDDVARAIAAVALELPPLRHAECATLYASLPDEPGTDLLRAGLRELGIRVLLPIVPPTADPLDPPALDWAEDEGELNRVGPLGLAEPTGPRLGAAELGKAQLVIVPALAVDTTGNRLGRGRGYYDAALINAHPDALILALVHDEEVLDADSTPIPREGHDTPVHGVITPTRWMFFTGRTSEPSPWPPGRRSR